MLHVKELPLELDAMTLSLAKSRGFYLQNFQLMVEKLALECTHEEGVAAIVKVVRVSLPL